MKIFTFLALFFTAIACVAASRTSKSISFPSNAKFDIRYGNTYVEYFVPLKCRYNFERKKVLCQSSNEKGEYQITLKNDNECNMTTKSRFIYVKLWQKYNSWEQTTHIYAMDIEKIAPGLHFDFKLESGCQFNGVVQKIEYKN